MLASVADLGLTVVLLLLVAAFAAGWIDAVIGGGGLLQLPVLLLVPGVTPLQALATNKLASLFGTTTSAITYARRAPSDLRTAFPMAGVALVGSFTGASVASLIPAAAFRPIILGALIVVAVITLVRPALGTVRALKHTPRVRLLLAAVLGLVVGFYDGMIGPGTGTFLVLGLIAALGYDFLLASATAKIVNVATNLGALLFFIPAGYVLWVLGLGMGVANVAGGYLGSRMAVTRGSRFIRIAFLVVVGALIVKLSVDVVTAL